MLCAARMIPQHPAAARVGKIWAVDSASIQFTSKRAELFLEKMRRSDANHDVDRSGKLS